MAKASKHITGNDVLHVISKATSGLVGKDLLEEMCRNFTRALKMQFELVAECIEEGSTHVRTLCLVNGDAVMDNIEYDTTGRPCELILQGKEVFVPKEVYKKFPEAKGIEAATGVPIYSSVSGNIIGHIIVSNLQPVTEESNQTTILKISNGTTTPVTKLEDVEKEHIIEPLKKTGWKVSGEKGAAKILGLNPTTLEARMKKLGIKREV